MKIGIPDEIHDGECRVAVTPDSAKRLQRLGFSVAMETGAGETAHFSDEAYREVGVEIVDGARRIWEESDIVLKVRPPEAHPKLGIHEADLLAEGAILASFIWPAQNEILMEKLRARQATVLALDSVPRISRAQKMDALSSMANIAGYRAVIEAAGQFGNFFTGQITAAGKIPPAKVLVIGAGVAGLAAVGTAVGLGAIVRAFDTRLEVKEQVESLGAEFLELAFEEEGGGGGAGGYAKVMSEAFIKAEMDLFARQAMDVDIIITTALIPGKPAPTLITASMVGTMREGSVIVDLAAEQGGNCELTEPGEIAIKDGVSIIGYTDMPSRMASQASELYARNLWHLLSDMVPDKDGVIALDMEDDVMRSVTVIESGAVTWPPPAPKIATPIPPPARPQAEAEPEPAPSRRSGWQLAAAILGGVGLLAVGLVVPETFIGHLTVFVLACFVGWQVIWNVTPALHTPLMSVTNAISGIIVVGGILQIASPSPTVTILAVISVLVAMVNVAGGFLVTQRMLRMFRKE